MIVYVPVIYFTGIFESMSNPVGDMTATVLALAAGFGSFLAIHGYFLATSGQTVAKRMLGMQIVSVEDNRTLPFGKLIGLRYAPLYLVGLIPVLGNLIGLINPLTIFGNERRCLHDYVAGTKVIRVYDPVEPWVGLDKSDS